MENQTHGSTTRFDDWNETVNCNECARYWDSSCDGVSCGVKRTCTSFLATRSVVIPEQLNAVRDVVKWLLVGHICSWAVVISLVVILLGKI